ncbi:hypothetical protein CRUP_026252 [Coryphaenoides rupestris]|nr:hypothetical protein CRUP_026252 [Coryphaenoides rupestris]
MTCERTNGSVFRRARNAAPRGRRHRCEEDADDDDDDTRRTFQKQGKDVERVKQRLAEIANYVDKMMMMVVMTVVVMMMMMMDGVDAAAHAMSPSIITSRSRSPLPATRSLARRRRTADGGQGGVTMNISGHRGASVRPVDTRQWWLGTGVAALALLASGRGQNPEGKVE